MSHAYANNYLHCVFSTKDRAPIIPTDLQAKLWAYVRGIARNLDIPLIAVGGTDNHIHLLLRLPATLPLATAIQKPKANSSRWLNQHRPGFEWQPGYGAFSVSPSNLARFSPTFAVRNSITPRVTSTRNSATCWRKPA